MKRRPRIPEYSLHSKMRNAFPIHDLPMAANLEPGAQTSLPGPHSARVANANEPDNCASIHAQEYAELGTNHTEQRYAHSLYGLNNRCFSHVRLRESNTKCIDSNHPPRQTRESRVCHIGESRRRFANGLEFA